MLPVPVDQLISQPMQYDYNQPPANLGSLQQEMPTEIVHHINTLGSLVANELSAKATSNSLRAFVFNLSSQDNWRNIYYIEAVRIACALFVWTLRSSGYQQAMASMPQLAQKSIDMFIAKCVINYPDLRNIMTQQQIWTAEQTYNQLENLYSSMNTMQNPNVYQPQMQQAWNSPVQQGWMGGMQQPTQQGWGGNIQQPQFGMGQNMMHRPIQTQPMPAFGVTNANVYTKHQEQQTTVQDRYSSRSQSIEEITTKNTNLSHVSTGVSVTMPTLLSEVAVNRDKHTITIDSVQLSRNKREFLALDRINNLGEDLKPISPSRLSVCVLDHTLIADNYDEIITSCRIIKEQKKLDDIESQILMVNAVFSSTFITPEDMSDYIKSITRKRGLVNIAKGLEEFRDKIIDNGGNSKVQLLALFKYINRTLTNFVNDYLRIELDMKTSIDSFIEDAENLVVYIQNNYPSEYIEYLEKMSSIINETFMPDIKDAEDILKEDFLEDSGVSATLFTQSVSLTIIDLFYEELGYALQPNVSYRIQENNELLKAIIDKLSYGDPMSRFPTHKHYLVTMDNVKLTLHKSIVQEDVYLIAIEE